MFKIKFRLLYLLFLMMLCVCAAGYSQPPDRELTTTSARARKAFERAIEYHHSWNTRKAIEEYLRAIEIDPDFIEPHIILAEIHQKAGRHEEAIKAYIRAEEINPDFYPFKYFYLAESYLKLGRYEEAQGRLEYFLLNDDISDRYRKQSERKLEICRFAIEAKKSPVPFDPVNIGEAINTEHAEYSPSLTADEQTIYFTRMQRRDHSSVWGASEYEDLYFSTKVDGEWQPAENLGEPVNTPGNEGFLSISADGQHLFFTACNRPDGVGNCDIYYSRRRGQAWETPANMGVPVNSWHWDSQPSTTADGKTLYFTSSRGGGVGVTDIWVTKFQSDSKWSNPENLGPLINTIGQEISPFIHPDNNTLYFASNGHLGMGGYDLFYSRRDEEGNWTEPVNLGYPINTHGDELSLFIGAGGRNAYFASDVGKETRKTDIYFFELYEEARPDPLTYMRGFVFDVNTRRPLKAKFELIDLKNDLVLINSESDPINGNFLVAIPAGINIGLNVSAKGYLFYSENFTLERKYTGIEPYLMDIPLNSIQAGASTILRNIFFEYDKYELKPESKAELNRLVSLIQENPDIKVEIGGHTDNIGSYEYNQELSLNRARSVFEYLVEKGINANRIEYKGYAFTKPIDTNETEEGRANNRRTEFTIVE